MKGILTCIGLLAYAVAFSQQPKLKQLWIGDANNYLKIDSDAIRVEYYYEFDGQKHVSTRTYSYTLSNDILKIIEPIYNGIITHDFLIAHTSANELELFPLSPNSKLLAFTETPKKILTFHTPEGVYTDTISFEKIILQTTTCYGQCPAMAIQIDSSRQVQFIGGKFADKEGYYTSALSNKLYSRLLKILATSNLDKLENNDNFNVDLPTITLEVHYNNKTKYIKSSFPPFITIPLLRYLIDLPKQVELKETGRMAISSFQ